MKAKLLGYSYSQNIREVFKEASQSHFVSSQDLSSVNNNTVVCSVGFVLDSICRTSASGNKYARIDIADERGNISMLLMDNTREAKLTNFLNSGKKIPKKAM